jgi:glyoxylase-like metal-dependent hydrolase (beta-lactamase superfamily II)
MNEPAAAQIFVHTEVVEPFAENARVVGCHRTRSAVLVDPGGRVDELLAVARDGDLRIEAIWLTHAHIDHVTGVGDAIAALGPLPILLHPDDLPIYEAVPHQAAMFGLTVAAQPAPTDWLVAGQTLALGALRARVLFLPGHSPGHVGFWFEAENTLLSGDVLFAGSIGRTDLPGGDYDTLIASIRTKVLALDDTVRVLAGHGPDTTVGRERATNPFLNR